MNPDFYEKVNVIAALAREDPDFYERLTGAASAGQLAEICRQQGIEVSVEEATEGFAFLKAYLAEGESRALSDAELERVAAGGLEIVFWKN